VSNQNQRRPRGLHGPGPNVSVADFEALLAGGAGLDVPFFEHGQEVDGRVVRVERDAIYLDLGGKSEGVLPVDTLPKGEDGQPTLPALGDVLRSFVVGTGGGAVQLAARIGRSRDNLDMLFNAHESEIPVEGRVVATNKGGYEVDLGGARGFCPHSQMDLRFVDDPLRFVGLDLKFRITEIREGGRNVLLSRRALLEVEEAERRAETMAVLKVGAELDGIVRSLRPFGAFVDLGGVDGLVHVSELSHERVEDPASLLDVGQTVRVRVMAIEEGGKRISLSMKALQDDPWETVDERFPVGSRLQGKVVRIAPFGAFVNLAPGIDGLLHISALGAGRRISHPKEVLQEGQELEVIITQVELARQRIGLELADAPAGFGAQDPESTPELGAVFQGTVERVERFGIFVRMPGGRTGLAPRSELEGASQGDLRRDFPEGSELQVKLVEVDEARGRYTLSTRALHRDAEQELVRSFQKAGASAPSAGGMGTLGDLLRAKLERGKS